MNGRLEHDRKIEQRIEKILKTLPQYMEEWDLNMKASGQSANTRENYLIRIRDFFSYIKGDPKNVELSDINSTNTQKWFISKQTRKKGDQIVETSDSQKCVTWACLNAFFSYMVRREYMSENPVLLIDKPKNHDLARINQNRKLLTAKDFQKILKALDNDNLCDPEYKTRNWAILYLLMMTGMRKTALTEINIEDVNMEKKEIRIIDKRKKLHIYPMDVSLYLAIKAWLRDREVLLSKNEADCDALFLSHKMTRLQAKGVHDVVQRYSKMGLGYAITPHKIRAGYASILYSKTHDLEFVRRAIGHADVSTTTRYIVTEGKERKEAGEILGGLLS